MPTKKTPTGDAEIENHSGLSWAHVRPDQTGPIADAIRTGRAQRVEAHHQRRMVEHASAALRESVRRQLLIDALALGMDTTLFDAYRISMTDFALAVRARREESTARSRNEHARDGEPRRIPKGGQAGKATGGATRKPRRVPSEVDRGVRKIIRDNQPELVRLAKAVMAGEAGAKDEWRALLGRNTLMKKLGCSAKLITESQPWRAIAEPLGLAGPRPGAGREGRVGMVIAENRETADRKSERKEADETTDERIDRYLKHNRRTGAG